MVIIPSEMSPPPQPALLLPLLRERTRDLHLRVETSMDLDLRFSSHKAYFDLLSRLYVFYVHIEDALASEESELFWKQLGIEFRGMRKYALLATDLIDLGASQHDLLTLQIGRSVLERRFRSIGDVIGTAYVLEGSTLGGQVISRKLESSLGISPGAPGGSFFNGYGSKTRLSWQTFCASIEAFVVHQQRNHKNSVSQLADIAVFAARCTFSDIEVCLTQLVNNHAHGKSR